MAAGLCTLVDLKATLDLDDVGDLNEILLVRAVNERRHYEEMMTKHRNARGG